MAILREVPILEEQEDEVVVNLYNDTFNGDWLKTLRLMRRVEAGDKEAELLLRGLSKTKSKQEMEVT